MGYNRQEIMETLKKIIFVTFLIVLGFSTITAQEKSQPKEVIIGSVSGTLDGGETYELYKRSADSLGQFLRGWKWVGSRDKMVTFSDAEIYEKCLAEAKRIYGILPNMHLKDLHTEIEYKDLPDEEYHTNEIGSSTEYRKKQIKKREYIYSAKVVVNQ